MEWNLQGIPDDRVDAPYPKVQASGPNRSAARQMLDNVGGSNSEMPAVAPYVCNGLIPPSDGPLAMLFHRISIVICRFSARWRRSWAKIPGCGPGAAEEWPGGVRDIIPIQASCGRCSPPRRRASGAPSRNTGGSEMKSMTPTSQRISRASCSTSRRICARLNTCCKHWTDPTMANSCQHQKNMVK